MNTPETWIDLETALGVWPIPRIAMFAARRARRLFPHVPRLVEDFGPEAEEWSRATAEAIRVVEAFGRGERVTRFSRDLAAEAARCAANATATAAQLVGPSRLIEPAELAYAAAAFAADAARSTSPGRAASFAVRAARMEATGPVPTPEQLADFLALNAGQECAGSLPPLPARESFRLLAGE